MRSAFWLVALVGCGTSRSGGSGADAATDTATGDKCTVVQLDTSGWERAGTAILDTDAQYLLWAQLRSERLDISMIPPANNLVEQPPKWNGMLSPPDFAVSDRDVVYPRYPSIEVKYQNDVAGYRSQEGTMTLVDLEMPSGVPGQPVSHFHLVLHDVRMTTEDGIACIRLSADVSLP